MSKLIESDIESMDNAIHKCIERCALTMSKSCTTSEESIDAMAYMIDSLSIQHQSLVWALIGTLMELRAEGECAIPDSALRATVYKCRDEFSKQLIANVTQSCADAGYSNIFDANQEVREEILNDNL